MASAPAINTAFAQDVKVLLTAEFPDLDTTEMGGELPMVGYHLYCRLYSFDPSMTPKPDLVEKETISDDKLTWTLKLRSGATFHDGTPVNAEAVKYTIDRMLADSGSGRLLFTPITETKVIDDTTVALRTAEPFPALRNNLASPLAGIVSPTADKRLGKRFGVEPISCGPYAFKSWTRGSELSLSRFDKFYGPKPPYSSITFQFVPEASTRMFMMMNGEADIALRLGPVEAEQLRSRGVKVQEINGRTIFYQLNFDKAPTDDIRVRQAINYAVDKQAIIKNVLAGGGTLSQSVLASNTFSGAPIGSYAYDPERAKALLNEAGATNAKITLYATQNRYFNDGLVAQAIAGYLREVGLDTTVILVADWGSYIDRVAKLDFNLYTLSLGSTTGDPDNILQGFFGPDRIGKTWNFGAYKNDEVAALVAEARSTVNDDERKAMYLKIQQKIFADVPWLFMYRTTSYMALSNKITTLHVLEGPEFPYLFDLPK
jgi:peptide/nickel transport system substrate-binding protein